MTDARERLTDLSDDDLLIELRRSVAADRAATARVVEVLAEVDARRLYLAEGCSSLFMYCTHVLHLSEHAAYNRIEAARLARRMPQVAESLRRGDVTLTAICLLGPHLTTDNCHELLAAGRHKSKREVEQIVAALDPKPDARASVRRLPVRMAAQRPANDVVRAPAAATPTSRAAAPAPTDSSPIAGGQSGEARKGSSPGAIQALPSLGRPERFPRAVISPLAPERYRIQFTASREVHDKLRRAQDLLRHTIPDGDVAAVFDRALTLLVEELERRKLAAVARPRPPQSPTSHSRYIPAAVKRIVWARDGGQCTFVGTQGRCTERGFLEMHHLVPFAAGGETSAGNLALRCRAHNAYEGEQFFGPLFARERPRPRYAGFQHSFRNEFAPVNPGCCFESRCRSRYPDPSPRRAPRSRRRDDLVEARCVMLPITETTGGVDLIRSRGQVDCSG